VRTASPSRRAALRGLAGVALGTASAALLSACGFRLRRPVSLGYQRIAVQGFKPRSPMLEALRTALPSDVQLQDTPKDAEVILTALQDHFYRTVAASTATGQVREWRLRVLLKYRLSTPDGHILVDDTELEQSRDLSYTETSALAKEQEEAMLVREMRSDIAAQLLRMLASTGHRPTP
jgi:LPS-assembly lipoprotein